MFYGFVDRHNTTTTLRPQRFFECTFVSTVSVSALRPHRIGCLTAETPGPENLVENENEPMETTPKQQATTNRHGDGVDDQQPPEHKHSIDSISPGVRGHGKMSSLSFLMWIVMVLVPWALLLGPYVSPTWRDQVHKTYVHEPLVRFVEGLEAHATNGATNDTSDSTTTATTTCPIAPLKNVGGEEVSTPPNEIPFLEPGSLVEVSYESEYDDPDMVYWYKATLIGLMQTNSNTTEEEDTFHVNYALDDTDEFSVTRRRLRPYVAPQEQNLLQLFEDDMFHPCKIQRLHKDGTYDVYVPSYDDAILTSVPADVLRRVEVKHKPSYKVKRGTSIHDYLNPKLLEDPETFQDIGRRLQNGELVVIRDAFRPEFAQAMHQDLDDTDNWQLHEVASSDGFTYHHHNVYEMEDYSDMMNDAYAMFDHPDTKEFIYGITKRDCSGVITGSPSYYHPGDYSMPHTDFKGERTVAFVWHLSKNWSPEWGGGLHWTPELSYNAFQHASFNTLSLFVVNPTTFHFVTSVTQEAMEKRLAFNGWWNSNFHYDASVPFEDQYTTPEQRYDLSRGPFDWIRFLDLEEVAEERREKVAQLQEELEAIEWPEATEIHTIYAEEL